MAPPSTQVKRTPSGLTIQLGLLDRAGYERFVELRTGDPDQALWAPDGVTLESLSPGVLVARWAPRAIAVVDPERVDALGWRVLAELAASVEPGWPSPAVGVVGAETLTWMSLGGFLAGEPVRGAGAVGAQSDQWMKDPREMWALLDSLVAEPLAAGRRCVNVEAPRRVARALWEFVGGGAESFIDSSYDAPVAGLEPWCFSVGRVRVVLSSSGLGGDDVVIVRSLAGPAKAPHRYSKIFYRPELVGVVADVELYQMLRAEQRRGMEEVAEVVGNLGALRRG